MAATPVCLPGKSRGQRSLEGYSPWDRTESDTAEAAQHGTGSGVWVSVVAARGLDSCHSRAAGHRLYSCGPWAQLHFGMWDLPRPGIEPMSPALADGFFNNELPGMPYYGFINSTIWNLTSCFLILISIGLPNQLKVFKFLYPKVRFFYT